MNHDRLNDLQACGACAGVEPQTPVAIENRPSLSAIAYRTGTLAQFKASLAAGLTSSQRSAIARLLTREPDDFSMALLDAFACMADVLAFYQERIANESYLRTATERRSLREMSRLVGYRLRPGVAAQTWLALTLEEAPGSPATLVLEPGLQVQSVPGPDETPQVFETVEAIEVRAENNALRPQRRTRQSFTAETKDVVVHGIDTRLQPGDAILLLDPQRWDDSASPRWALRSVRSVNVHAEEGYTVIAFEAPLGFEVGQDARSLELYALRQRAALFGHNAPQWKTMPFSVIQAVKLGAHSWDPTTWGQEWPGEGFDADLTHFDLDAVYPRLAPGSWLATEFINEEMEEKLLHMVRSTKSVSRADFAMSAKVTRIEFDNSDNDDFKMLRVRNCTVYAQSERLELVDKPIDAPLYGAAIALDRLALQLRPGQAIAIRGKRQRLLITAGSGMQLVDSAGAAVAEVKIGDVLELMAPPLRLSNNDAVASQLAPAELMAAFHAETPVLIRWQSMNRAGIVGFATASSSEVCLLPAAKDDPEINEIAFIRATPDAVSSDGERTTVELARDLANCFERSSVAINANVVAARHGETVQQILSGGDASRGFQTFDLKHAPLTYVSADTASGSLSTLEVRVNEIPWREAPTLYNRTPDEHVFSARTDDGATAVTFGDGTNGARLPTGQGNVRATYRKGIGAAGNVGAGALSQLMTRPLGLKAAVNPTAAIGGTDPESTRDVRRNVPLGVRTLDRAVSLRDYEDFARAFAGIRKAHAAVLPLRAGPTVFVTAAGENGAVLTPDDQVLLSLTRALRKCGDPQVRVEVGSYRPATFSIGVRVIRHPDHSWDKVRAAVQVALLDAFSFDVRELGEPVFASDVIARVQRLEGVRAVDLDIFDRGAGVPREGRLLAEMPTVGAAGRPVGAELLTLAPCDLRVEEKP